MKIYCDENVESAIVEGLRRRNIEVISARDSGNLGKSDEYHLEFAKKINAVILTHDIDYIKLAHQWNKEKKEHKGIIFTHQQYTSIGKCIRRVELVINLFSMEEMTNYIEFI